MSAGVELCVTQVALVKYLQREFLNPKVDFTVTDVYKNHSLSFIVLRSNNFYPKLFKIFTLNF